MPSVRRDSPVHRPNTLGSQPLPRIDTRQFLALTDGTGMIQHATFGAPDHHHGYCVDDNCRALLAAVLHAHICGYDEQLVPLQRYLAFVSYGFNAEAGRFRNFMSYERKWLEDVGSEESQTRSIWALGVTVRLAPNDSIRGLAERLFLQALPAVEDLEHLRPWAYALLGMEHYVKAGADDAAVRARMGTLAARFFAMWQENSTDDWPWWDDTLTWGNAKLPNALLVAGDVLGDQDMVRAGLKSLKWLVELQTAEKGHFSFIGNAGWYERGGTRAQFDQQPIEAQSLLQASLAAARVSGDESWVDVAWRSFRWFTGANDLGLALYNAQTGGCHDGLQPGRVNWNQGAESTLAYLLSVLELHWTARARW